MTPDDTPKAELKEEVSEHFDKITEIEAGFGRELIEYSLENNSFKFQKEKEVLKSLKNKLEKIEEEKYDSTMMEMEYFENLSSSDEEQEEDKKKEFRNMNPEERIKEVERFLKDHKPASGVKLVRDYFNDQSLNSQSGVYNLFTMALADSVKTTYEEKGNMHIYDINNDAEDPDEWIDYNSEKKKETIRRAFEKIKDKTGTISEISEKLFGYNNKRTYMLVYSWVKKMEDVWKIESSENITRWRWEYR